MNQNSLSSVTHSLFAAWLVFACSASDSSDRTGSTGGGGSGVIDLLERPTPKGCGDGVLTEDEACDDANLKGSDGCMANCLGIDPGFICPVPGQLCIAYAKCGDGIVSFPEQCDDGGEEPMDGCSSTCKVELGFKCSSAQPTQPSTCSPTVCGDGVAEGAETCDNGPDVDGDGCSSQCIGEPDCSAGACTSSCGDGLVLGEACDDGNLIDGDGCSSKCMIEAGYECTQDTDCSKDENGKCAITIPVVYRDFSKDHPDFEEGTSCSANGPTKGMVQNKLVSGKPVPVPVGGKLDCRHIDEWYRDSDKSTTHVGSIVLYDNGSGGYVNRWGPNGERWIQYSNFQWVSEVYEQCSASGCIRCDYAPEKGCSATASEKDGDPLFFPIDGIPSAKDDGGFYAEVSNRYWTQYTLEGKIFPGAPKHNFHFTTEVTYWFGYDESTDATLDFTGDDDLWVFVNGTLAVDVGGVHEAENGSVRINATTAASFGLAPGNVYEIKIFHAERQTTASSFRLTLDGFTTTRSDCTPVCGDGIIGVGEQCDDGVNDGGYNQCQPGCVLGAYCGNGVIDEGESCDDADPKKPSDCAGCRRVVIK